MTPRLHDVQRPPYSRVLYCWECEVKWQTIGDAEMECWICGEPGRGRPATWSKVEQHDYNA